MAVVLLEDSVPRHVRGAGGAEFVVCSGAARVIETFEHPAHQSQDEVVCLVDVGAEPHGTGGGLYINVGESGVRQDVARTVGIVECEGSARSDRRYGKVAARCECLAERADPLVRLGALPDENREPSAGP